MSATFTHTGDKGVVTLKGDLTLQHAEEMKKAFLKALLNADSVIVSFGNIREVDLSCLQLLCSAHRSAVRLKKRVMFSEDLPPAMRNAADVAGYARLKGCRLDCEGSCLWMEAVGVGHER